MLSRRSIALSNQFEVLINRGPGQAAYAGKFTHIHLARGERRIVLIEKRWNVILGI